eukprot:14758299-Alexandrium_andersonii.AAC.1
MRAARKFALQFHEGLEAGRVAWARAAHGGPSSWVAQCVADAVGDWCGTLVTPGVWEFTHGGRLDLFSTEHAFRRGLHDLRAAFRHHQFSLWYAADLCGTALFSWYILILKVCVYACELTSP